MCHPGICRGHRLANGLVGADLLRYQIQKLLIARKSIGIEFGEDRLLVDGDFEPPTVAWFQGNVREVLVVLINDHFHRTGGVLGIASRSAVLKLQLVVHSNLL